MAVNRASRRVLEKAGLHLVRIFHQPWPYWVDGRELGDAEYALSKAEWEQQNRITAGHPYSERTDPARAVIMSCLPVPPLPSVPAPATGPLRPAGPSPDGFESGPGRGPGRCCGPGQGVRAAATCAVSSELRT